MLYKRRIVSAAVYGPIFTKRAFVPSGKSFIFSKPFLLKVLLIVIISQSTRAYGFTSLNMELADIKIRSVSIFLSCSILSMLDASTSVSYTHLCV